MPTKNIECQLASGQIGRYLAGDQLSSDAVSQLEAHIAECPDCQELVADRRKALLAMLSQNGAAHAVVEMPVAEPKAPTNAPAKAAGGNPMAEAIRRAMAEQRQQAKPKPAARETEKTAVVTPTPASFTKPLILSCLLATVLIGMTYFTRNGGGLLGPKAAAAIPEANATKSTVVQPIGATPPTATKPIEQPPIPAATPAATTPKSTVTPVATQPAETPKPKPTPAATQPVTTPAAPKPTVIKPEVAKPPAANLTPVAKPSASTVAPTAAPIRPRTRAGRRKARRHVAIRPGTGLVRLYR